MRPKFPLRYSVKGHLNLLVIVTADIWIQVKFPQSYRRFESLIVANFSVLTAP